MRGFLGGLILGAVTMLAVAASVSLMKPLLQAPDVTATAPSAGQEGQQGGEASGVDDVGRDADLVAVAPTVPSTEGTEPDGTGALEEADRTPADKPSVGAATGDLSGPAEVPGGAGVAVVGEVPVEPTGAAAPPAVPEDEARPAPAADQPAQPAMPDMSETGSGFAGPATGGDTAPAVPTRTDPEPGGETAVATVSEPGSEAAPAASTEPAGVPAAAGLTTPQTPPRDESDTARAPAGDSAPQVGDTAPGLPQVVDGEGQTPAAGDSGEPPAAPRIAALPQAGAGDAADRPGIGTRVVPLTERDDEPEETAPAAAPAAQPGLPPIRAFAAPFQNPENKPLMAIVLIDDAESIGAEALADFPYPVTFAVDPSAPDAAARMARHRADGFEVAVLADLARGASPQDAETSIAVWLDAVPEAVAVLEGPRTGVQGSRALSDQVAAIAGREGLGLVLQNNGLNTAQKLAARAGVPSAVVFRDFDGAGQTATVMRRFLDQAAFRARQDGAVIMMGRVRPETVSALILWGLQDRASQVALAPLSAVLTAGQP